MVNEGVITNYDIDQRIRLLEALGANGDLRKLAVQQLTEDRIKVQAAANMEIGLPEGAIEVGIDEFATGRGLTMDDVTASPSTPAASTSRPSTTSSSWACSGAT